MLNDLFRVNRINKMKSKEFNAGLLVYKIIAYVCIAFFLFCAVMAWRA